MQQCCTDTGRAQSDLFAGYLSYGNGVHDIRFARESSDSLVCLTGKVESLSNNIHLLAVT